MASPNMRRKNKGVVALRVYGAIETKATGALEGLFLAQKLNRRSMKAFRWK